MSPTRISDNVTFGLKQGLASILPGRCYACSGPCEALRALCIPCERDLRHNTLPCDRCGAPHRAPRCQRCRIRIEPFEGVLAPLVFNGPIRELLHHWKFNRCLELTPVLSRFVAQAIIKHSVQADCLVPITSHWWRRWRRGFEPIGILANETSHQLATLGVSLPVVQALYRVRHTRAQHRSSYLQRDAQLSGVFQSRQPLSGKSVVLLDDVMTSGATARHASTALLEAGVSRVIFAAIARTAGESESE